VGTLKGRESHYDAQSIFKLHVSGPFPKLAARPAGQVEAEELRDVLARLIEAGKGRTAAKLRAFLRAAFGMAMRAGLDPTLPEALTAFDIQVNPADRLPSLAQFSKALDRALTLPELHAFWRRVEGATDSPARDALKACMYLGGQRPTQVLRLTPQLVDVSGATLTLLDPKGRNRHANPRRHVLPIHADLMPAIRGRLAQTESAESPLFSTNGRVPLRKETVAQLVAEIAQAMQVAGELERGPFSLRDLRRTAETHMAALGVSRDVRAQIQSHGLGGIQARHYDRHDYMPEKRAALALWVQRFRNLPLAPRRTSSRAKAAQVGKRAGGEPAVSAG
jgi:integrase